VQTKLPTSRVGRLARLAAIGARAGAGRIASSLGATDGEVKVAQAAAQALGTMRGLALKMGQMASYVDGFVPDDHKGAYELAMRSLRDAAPTMSAEAAATIVEAELGAPPGEVFAEWSPEPFASASIGQVHRATLHDGRAVAVKVQYEGVSRAVAADLSNVSTFGALLGPIGSKFALKEQLAEMRARFTEELDYAHEAAQQKRFGRIFGGHPTVLVPEVVDDRSTGRVLTTGLAGGIGFEEACARSDAERRAWAESLWTFVFTSLLGHGLFNADPHPGNYVFGPEGRVWFLDFGCTREVSPRRLEQVRAVHRAATAHDEDALYEAARVMLDMPEGGEQARLARLYILQCFAPITSRAPFRITRDYARALYEDMVANARAMLRGSRAEFAPLPAEWLFFNRLQLGFYSVLARLDVAVDYNAVDRRCLP
jgi:predicted unusual protein kinase regulating ubiquinone biosynthesis (AarF/ABC1/UbiB family)